MTAPYTVNICTLYYTVQNGKAALHSERVSARPKRKAEHKVRTSTRGTSGNNTRTNAIPTTVCTGTIDGRSRGGG